MAAALAAVVAAIQKLPGDNGTAVNAPAQRGSWPQMKRTILDTLDRRPGSAACKAALALVDAALPGRRNGGGSGGAAAALAAGQLPAGSAAAVEAAGGRCLR